MLPDYVLEELLNPIRKWNTERLIPSQVIVVLGIK